MRHLYWILGLLVALAVAPAAHAAASGDSGTKPAQPATADITPAASGPITAMCDFLKAQKKFSFTADILTELVYPNGQTIQISRKATVAIERPNKAYSHVVGDDCDREYFYDGKTVTLVDRDRGVYAVTEAPATIDATTDMLAEKYGLSAPLSDFVDAAPCVALLHNVRTGDFVGNHMAAGKVCDHLAFTQKSADWQVWIEQGKMPLPRKFVLNDKDVPGWPQYAATFSDWNLHPKLPSGLFSFTPVKGMQRIEFLPLATKGQGKPE